MIEAFSGRGLGTVSDMVLSINDNTVELPVLPEIYNRQFNLRFFIEFPEEQVSFNETVLGTKIEHFDLEYFAVNGGKLDISSATNAINFEVDTSKITNGEYFLSCTVYHDKPIHHYPVLATLPIPTEILTYHFVFTKTQNVKLASFPVQKYFDGYSHLGFFLADLPKMKQIIEDKYGSKSLDLVDEFSNTTLIDDLFSAGVILIVWGVNPYTYPIFSAHKEDVSRLEIILGQAFTQKGIYRIDEGITKMSVVPGHELRNWPDFLDKDWTQLELFGEGETASISPYSLKDTDGEITLSSFLVTREKGSVAESQPLLNIDLLYNK